MMMAVVLMVLGWFAGTAVALDIVRLPMESQVAAGGANYLVVLDVDDLNAETNVNTALTFTNFSVKAGQAVQVIAAQLRTPFGDAATNAHNSTTLEVGDGTDADLYLASMQLNTNGTEVYFQAGNGWQNGTALGTNVVLTLQRQAMTDTNGVAASCVTNVLATFQTSTAVSGVKGYTAADTVDFKVSSMASYSLAELDVGEVWIYLKVWDRP